MIIHLTLLVLLLLLLLLLWLKPYKFIHAYYYKSLFVWCVSRKIHVMRGKSCDHSNNVAFCYFLSFFGPPMPCLYEEKLPTHLRELPSIVVSITVMIFFHITPSSPRSSHIWFSYIHNFRATLYEPTFLTFPYKTWQKVGWTKRLAQLGRYVMIHVGHCPIKHSQLFPIFSLHNSPLWSTHRGQLGQGKTNRARTKAILDNKSMHECCWLRQRGQHWFS